MRKDGIYVDATYGRGGHCAALLARLSPEARVFALDRDPQAIAHGSRQHGQEARLTLVQANFDQLEQLARDWGIAGKVTGLMLDLGVSSPQLDEPARGFSFNQDGPLDMRMNPEAGESAANWLAIVSEQELAKILWEYGEERHARRIARAIVTQRDQAPFTTTTQLATLVKQVVPGRPQKIHPATRTFQAIRIHVNDELGALNRVLPQAYQVLAPRGRLAVISFHSLEDRVVKRYIRQQQKGPVLPRHLPITADQVTSRMRACGKARRAGNEELAVNPRARSATLRIAERTA